MNFNWISALELCTQLSQSKLFTKITLSFCPLVSILFFYLSFQSRLKKSQLFERLLLHFGREIHCQLWQLHLTSQVSWRFQFNVAYIFKSTKRLWWWLSGGPGDNDSFFFYIWVHYEHPVTPIFQRRFWSNFSCVYINKVLAVYLILRTVWWWSG